MGDYDFAVDLADFNNTLTYQVRFTPRHRRVLDVGSATGFLVDALRRYRDADGRGVEIDPEAAREAQRRGSPVVVGDFTEDEVRADLLAHNDGHLFDVVVFGDVLEHLTDPPAALAAARRLLHPSGLVIASIPNVAHGSIRLDLLRGSFRYTPEGLLDRTHVQLFTLSSIRELFAGARFTIERLARSYYPILGTEGRVAAGDFPEQIYNFVAQDREAWVYQYVVSARMSDWSAASPSAQGRGALQRVDVVVDGDPRPELAGLIAKALPTSARLGSVDRWGGQAEPESLDGTGDETVVLLVPDDIVIEPAWVHALLDAHREHGGPVGCATVGRDGRVLQAGRVADEVFGWGDPWPDGPFCSADRGGVPLDLPRLGRARDVLGASATGRFVGGVVAPVTRPRPRPNRQASLGTAFERSVLFLARRPPVVWSTPVRDAFVKAVDGLTAEGLTPVVRWSAGQPLDARLPNRWLERRGVVLLGGDLGIEGPSSVGLPSETMVPVTSSLAARLGPVVTVVIDEYDEAEVAACLVAADTRLVLVGEAAQSPGLHRLADAAIGPADVSALCDAIVELARSDGPVAARGPEPEPVAAGEVVEGMVSFVIPVHNSWSHTRRCLDSLGRTDTPHEVIVVDNGSTDATPSELSQRGDVSVITNARNLGAAVALNQGIGAASGEFVCLLSNDAELVAGAVEEMLATLAVPGTGMVGVRATSASGPQAVDGAPPYPVQRDEAVAWAQRWMASRSGRSWLLDRLDGTCLLSRRSTFETFGGLDEQDHGPSPTDELCQRLVGAGLDLRVADGALALHVGRATFAESGIDYVGALRAGTRSAAGRERPSRASLCVALVLSDTDVVGAVQAATSALAVADRVVVLERGARHHTELCTGVRPPAVVDVVALDWRDAVAFARFVAGLRTRLVLMLTASELLVVDDVPRARQELEDLVAVRDDVSVAVGDGSEVRFVAAGSEAISSMGSQRAPDTSEVRIAGP